MDSYQKVFDRRNRRVRGLWVRNGIYYAQISVDRRCTKVRLHGDTVADATVAMQALKMKRREGSLVINPVRGAKSFQEVADSYIEDLQSLSKKRPGTIERESSSVDSLKAFMGDRPITKVAMADAHAYSKWRKDRPRRSGLDNVSGRAIDVDIVVLRNVMKKAMEDGLIRKQPIEKWQSLADDPREVRLISTAEIEKLRAAGGKQFSDYLGVLAASGGREKEALRLRWSVNVDWIRKRLGFGQDGLSKFGKSRWMPFNPPLEALLTDMHARKTDSDLMFPSPYGDDNVKSFKKSMAGAKLKCGIAEIGFHHFRHYFISHCLMSGVDVKTIANWVGHEDIRLISRIYGHISSQHSVQQAAKVKFGD